MSATIKCLKRDKLGSRHARRLRLQGRIPASIHGEGKENCDLSIPEAEFLTARRHHEHLFDFELEGAETETAMVRELQWDPFGERIIHVEFRRVVRGQKTEVEVELDFTGHPKAGVTNHLVTQVTVSCLPTQIPDSIEVRVDGLDIGSQLHVKDLVVPEGVEVLLDPETAIAVVSQVRSVEETTPEETPEGEGETPAEGETPEADPASDG